MILNIMATLKIRIKVFLSFFSYIVWFLIKNHSVRLDNHKSKNILIVLTGALGDSLAFVPLIRKLSNKYHLYLYCRRNLGDLFYYSDINIKKIAFEEERSLKDLIKTNKFKCIILATFRANYEAELTQAGNIRMLRYPGRSLLPLHLRNISNLMFPYYKVSHPVVSYYSFLKYFGFDTKNISPSKYPMNINLKRKKIKEILSKFNLSGNYVILSASSINQKKVGVKFPSSEKLAKISDYIVKNYGYYVILDGLNDDIKMYLKIIKKSKSKEKIISVAGKTSLFDLAAILNKAKLLIAVDSGAVHLAATQNIPTISIIRKSIKDIWFPWMKKDNYRLICCEEKNLDSFSIDDLLKDIDYFLSIKKFK